MDVAPLAHAARRDEVLRAAAARACGCDSLCVRHGRRARRSSHFQSLQVAEELATSRRRTSRAPGRPPAAAPAAGRAGPAPTARWRSPALRRARRASRAARIMRPTRGSSGRRASSRPIGVSCVRVVDRAELVAAAGSRRRSRAAAAARGTGSPRRRRGRSDFMRRITPASDERRISGSVKRGRAVEVLLVVQPDADAVGHAAAAAGALVGRRLADRLDQQLLDLVAEAVALDARRAGVDHVADARHRERGLGDVGREHDAAARAGVEDALLLGLRQAREQRQDLGAARQRLVRSGACAGGRPPRGSRARRAGRRGCRRRCASRQSSSTAVDDRVFEVVVARLSSKRAVAHARPGYMPARDLDHRRRPVRPSEMLREALGVDRRRGDDHLQVGPARQDLRAGSRAGSRC